RLRSSSLDPFGAMVEAPVGAIVEQAELVLTAGIRSMLEGLCTGGTSRQIVVVAAAAVARALASPVSEEKETKLSHFD
ncbi:MAG: hypothetical protein ACKPKO_14045, partial [Candidatus Fonsibacter sp.]